MNKLSKNSLKIQSMFSSIAPRYDLLNRLLSFGRDIYWRRFAVNQLPKIDRALFLDVATGTGDVAIEIVKQHTKDIKVIGIDFSNEMLKIGREKVTRLGYQDRIELCHGDVNSLHFEDNTFDGSIIAFGIRNLPDYKKGIQEMVRVVKENGRVVILEFTPLERKSSLTGFTSAQNWLFKLLFRLYLTKALPFIGEIISGGKGAYRYLSESVLDFPGSEKLKEIMQSAGLKEVKYHLLTFGIVAVHVGIK